MPAGDATQLLHASIATAFSNLDSARRDRPKLDVREEGWTEVWGGRRRGGRKDGPSDRELCGHRATPADFEAEEAAVRRDLQAALPPVPPEGCASSSRSIASRGRSSCSCGPRASPTPS